jgi:nucleoside-diphosphate-sugar epimerase
MRIAITGATGFLGGHVLTDLLVAGHNVQALTRKAQPARDGVSWVKGALDRPETLIALVSGCDAVVHIAGVVNAPDATGFDIGNRIGTANIVAASEIFGSRRFVHVSSLSAREPRLSLYGASKRAAEDVVMGSALDWVVVRPPAIYGPGDTDNLELFRFAKRGIIPLPPRGRLSLIHADDLARLLVTLVDAGPGRTRYDVDDGVDGGWSHKDYARAIATAVGKRAATVALPRAVVRGGARLDGLLRGAKAKLTADRAAYFCHPDWTIDAAQRPPADLWKPAIPTTDGLKATADWYRAVGWL